MKIAEKPSAIERFDGIVMRWKEQFYLAQTDINELVLRLRDLVQTELEVNKIKSTQWIPVSERMPETPYEGFGVHFYYSDCVLVAGKDWLGMAYYVTEDGESRWEFADARTKQVIDWVEITHWMPITPPESEVCYG